MARAPKTFSGVAVSLPSKVRGSEAEEEWQEVDWVNWSTGDLSIDTDSFLLVLKDSAGAVKPKPLGNLVRASTVPSVVAGDEDRRTFVVTTSDSLHRLYRLTFPSTPFADEFGRLAEAAEAAHTAAASAGSAEAAESSGSPAIARLAAGAQERFAGRCPLVYGGGTGAVELYGPESNAPSASEVLLGRGVCVLVDPPEEEDKVGRYELLFFTEDEGMRKPAKSFQIGPKMSLKRLPQSAEDSDSVAVTLELVGGLAGVPAHQLAFDDEAMAAAFARDFRVRQRLMELSSKVVKRSRAADEARSELEELRQQFFWAWFWQWILRTLVALLVGALLRLAYLCYTERHVPPAAHARQLWEEFLTAGTRTKSLVVALTSKACQLSVGSVPISDIRVCLDETSLSKVRACFNRLQIPDFRFP